MITEMSFVAVPVTDMKRSRAFYEGVIGLKPTAEFTGENWIEYDLGTGTFGLGNYPGWTPSPQGTVVAFEVDDLDAEMARLKSNGVVIAFDVMDSPVCRCAMVCDPDGNKIMIHKRKAH
jgi:predicted enzyme related to lactoylglutathione lyase